MSGEQTLELIMKNNYKVILMDINMPIKDGLETTSDIRELCKRYGWNIHIVGVTGDSGIETNKKCIHAGMNAICSFKFIL